MRINNEDIQLERNLICTGALISAQDVLSAEHCFEGEEMNNIYILVNTIDLRSGTKHLIYWWLTYDTWAKQRKLHVSDSVNDVAIARVNYNFIKDLI
jgi:hypothetical protein